MINWRQSLKSKNSTISKKQDLTIVILFVDFFSINCYKFAILWMFYNKMLMIILIKSFLNSKLDLIWPVKFVQQLFRIQIQKGGKVLLWNQVKSRSLLFWTGFIETFLIQKNIIVNFIIQKLKSKHTSLKQYTNWDKLSCFSLYIFWENERKYFSHILGHSHFPQNVFFVTSHV